MMLLRSLRSRLMAAFLVPTVLLAAVAMGGYFVARDILEDELGQSLSRVAASAASQLSAERLLSIEPEDDLKGTRTFRNLSRQLTEVKEATGARRIFAFDAQGRVRVDAGGGLPAGNEVPELARDRLELARVLAGERAASQVLFQGSDGRLYKTGYAPLLLGGKVVGAVGVEGSSEFFGPLRLLLWGNAAVVALALLLLGGVALASARWLVQPLRRLNDSASRIGRGDLETQVPPEPTEEIGVLARALEDMRKGLESRDRQLKMMLAGVAHEVRNPIGGIELFAGLLAEDLEDVPGEARDHVAKVRREIDYLKRVVEDFLAFAREQKLALAPLEAGPLLQSAGELMRPDAEKKGVVLTLSAEPATVHGDQSLLLSAITNLLKNAVQASPERAVVELKGRADGDRYLVEVSNGGAGIPAEIRDKIFEPFFTTRQQGTGLGLPLARKIAQAHRGDLELRATPGLTTFVLKLPLAPAAGAA